MNQGLGSGYVNAITGWALRGCGACSRCAMRRCTSFAALPDVTPLYLPWGVSSTPLSHSEPQQVMQWCCGRCACVHVCVWQAPAALPAAVAFPASLAAALVVLDAAGLDASARVAPDQAPPPAGAPRAPRRPGRAAGPVVRTLKNAAARSAGPATPSPRPAAASNARVPVGLAANGSAGGGPRRCRELASLRRRPRLGEHYRALAGGCGGKAVPAAGAAAVDHAWGRTERSTGQGHSHVGGTDPRMPGVGPGAAGSEAAQPELVAATPAATLRGAAHTRPAADLTGVGEDMPACAPRSCEAALPLAARAGPADCSTKNTADDAGPEAAACAWASSDPPPAADSDAALTCAPAKWSSGPTCPVSAVGQGWDAEDGGSSSSGSVCSDLERNAVVDEGGCPHEGVPGRSGPEPTALELADSSPRQPCAGELAPARSPAAGAPGAAAERLLCGSANGSPASTGAGTPESACAVARQPASQNVGGTWAAHERAGASPRAQQLLGSAPSPCALEAHALHARARGDPQGTMLDGDPGCMAGAGAGSLAWAAEAARQQAAAEGGHACADPACAEGKAAGSLAARGADTCAQAATTAGQQAGGGGARAWGALACAESVVVEVPDPGADACTLAAVHAPSQPGGGDARARGALVSAEGKAADLPDPGADACALAAVSAPSPPGSDDARAWADTSSALRRSAGSGGGGGVSLGGSRSSAVGAGCCGDTCADGSSVSAESLPVQPGNPPWPPAHAAPAHDKVASSVSGDSWLPGVHAEAPHRSIARTPANMRGSACARMLEPGAGEQENWAGLSALACSPGAARDRRVSNPEGQRRVWAALAELPLLRQPLRQSNPARFQNPHPAVSPPAVPACAAPPPAGSCRASAPSASHALADLPQSPAAAAPSLPGPAWELGSGTQSCMQRLVCSAADRYSGTEDMDADAPAVQHESPAACTKKQAGAGGAGEHADHPPCLGARVSYNEPKAASKEVSCTAEPAERTAPSGPRVSQADAPDTSGQAARCCAAAEQPDQATLFTARTAHGGGPDSPGEPRRGRMRLLAAARRRAGRPTLLAEGSCRCKALGSQGSAGVASHTEKCHHGDTAACRSSAPESCSRDLTSAAGAPAGAGAAPALAAPRAGVLPEGGLDEQSCRAACASDDRRRGCEAGAGAAELSSPAFLCAALHLEAAAPAAGRQAGGISAAHVPCAPACGQAGPARAICSPHSAELPSEACGGAVPGGGSGASLNAQPHVVAEAAWSGARLHGLQSGTAEGACSSASRHAMPHGSAEVAGSSKPGASHDTTAGSACGGAGQSHLVFDPILGLYFDAASGQVFEEAAVKQMC